MAKMEENRNWTFNTQTCHESEEVLEDLCTLSTKMDVLLSWLEQREIIKEIVKPFKMHSILKINKKKILVQSLRSKDEVNLRQQAKVSIKVITIQIKENHPCEN